MWVLKTLKNIMCAKENIFGIILHVIVKMVKFLASIIINDSMTKCY